LIDDDVSFNQSFEDESMMKGIRQLTSLHRCLTNTEEKNNNENSFLHSKYM